MWSIPISGGRALSAGYDGVRPAPDCSAASRKSPRRSRRYGSMSMVALKSPATSAAPSPALAAVSPAAAGNAPISWRQPSIGCGQGPTRCAASTTVSAAACGTRIAALTTPNWYPGIRTDPESGSGSRCRYRRHRVARRGLDTENPSRDRPASGWRRAAV